ncbi:MAG: transposase [Planctomycetaceae bacterium]|nr:transposase [Planctomycetaceae bacterium]
MSQYRRNREGRVYFFTVVTDRRRPLLTSDLGRRALREAISETRLSLPFDITAIVLLPDHLHAVWELPEGDTDYSTRWRLIKTRFTKLWRQHGGVVTQRSESRRKRGEHSVWQRRFFEHTRRDERDLKRCIDYVHVNPLKHGLVVRVQDWPWSSFHRYVAAGEYPINWGSANEWYGDEFQHFE